MCNFIRQAPTQLQVHKNNFLALLSSTKNELHNLCCCRQKHHLWQQSCFSRSKQNSIMEKQQTLMHHKTEKTQRAMAKNKICQAFPNCRQSPQRKQQEGSMLWNTSSSNDWRQMQRRCIGGKTKGEKKPLTTRSCCNLSRQGSSCGTALLL